MSMYSTCICLSMCASMFVNYIFSCDLRVFVVEDAFIVRSLFKTKATLDRGLWASAKHVFKSSRHEELIDPLSIIRTMPFQVFADL